MWVGALSEVESMAVKPIGSAGASPSAERVAGCHGPHVKKKMNSIYCIQLWADFVVSAQIEFIYDLIGFKSKLAPIRYFEVCH